MKRPLPRCIGIAIARSKPAANAGRFKISVLMNPSILNLRFSRDRSDSFLGSARALACPFRRLAEMFLSFNQEESLARRQRQHAMSEPDWRLPALPRPDEQPSAPVDTKQRAFTKRTPTQHPTK